MRIFLQSLGIVKDVFEPTIVYSDSQTTIDYVKDPKYHRRTKHIDTKNNFLRDIIAQKKVILKYLSTCEIVVDLFTKSILRDIFSIHVKSLGLHRLQFMLIIWHESLYIIKWDGYLLFI